MRILGNRFNGICGAVAVLSTLAGCSEPAIEPAATAVVTPETTPVISAVADPASGAPIVPTPIDDADKALAEEVGVAKAGQVAAAPSDYTPPFPERVDLFVAPKRQGGASSMQGEGQDAVELLGFIRLDRPQVVLSVNGQIVPIDEGATQYGIEVISIQPPMVVLQRGRQRWQASLEN